MAETLVSSSGLGSAHGQSRRHGRPAAVELKEAALCTMFDLRLDPTDPELLNTAQQALRVDLPRTPNKSATANRCTAIWFGPDQWLLLLDMSIATALHQGLSRSHASLVDVSDLRAIFELSGPHAQDVLRKGCAIDVHPRAFGPGDCALTNFARVRVGLRQVDATPIYQLFVDRSYAEYLWTWLEDAMVEYVEG